MPISSPRPISAQAVTSGSSCADLAGADRLRAAPRRSPARQPVVVVAEHLGRDELGLPDDPVERRVLGGEAEVRLEAEQLRLERASSPCSRRLLHRVAHALVQVAHELVEDRLLRVEVEVEGALRDAGRLGDLHDRRVVVAELAEDGLGRVEQAAPRVEAAPRERPPVDVR